MNAFLKIIFVISFVSELCAQSVLWEEQNDAPAPIPVPREKTLIELHRDYFDIEKRLWERIESNGSTRFGTDDSERKMQTSIAIASIHKEVFFGVTFEMPNYWRSYLILGIEGLRDNLSIINATLNENYGYLYDAEDERVIFDAAKVDEWTREAMFRRLRTSIDGLFDITAHSDHVLRHIQRVRAGAAMPCTFFIVNFCIFNLEFVSVGSEVLHTIRHVRDLGAAIGARILCTCGQSNVARSRDDPTRVHVARVE